MAKAISVAEAPWTIAERVRFPVQLVTVADDALARIDTKGVVIFQSVYAGECVRRAGRIAERSM